MDEAAPLQIDLFADVVCPWCFLGSERLERVLATIGRPARVTHHPFLLDPNTPPEGDDVPARLQRKYGVPPERLWARFEAEARKSGLELVKNRETKEPMDLTPLKNFLIANGVYVFNFKNILFVVPPLVITEEQLDEGLNLLDEGLAELMDKQAS
jgi:predicted DsbA family dithiol-disulfide isomerase